MDLREKLKLALKELELPPMWLAVFAAIGWAVGQIAPLPIPYADWLGYGLVGLGLVISGLAAAQMVLARTTFIPRRQPQRLVTGGIFALSRNPIYLADAFILSGFLLIWDALFAAPLVPAFMAWITHRYIRGEEAWIMAAHGADYAAYCARVRRWL
ncbi:protein-S-isoprenylcysteine O-methyltransferase Ste14 [Rhodobacter sp. JA431]|uniref:methyltransferase family protein n=1 Tax=Rhodobacter sp. JA431 TaxID=570013 RepID=UPI000BD0E8AF|nr:methyltransferase [Rhodobacter sp. JA431]SOB92881.1 protein-S-isoprenylcysteine O-methyltransferase Ste14 [Rhodobacter sp. JA431]